MSAKESSLQMNQPRPQGLLREGLGDEIEARCCLVRHETRPLKRCVITQT